MEELKKFLNPLFFTIIIICFFLPFFNLMCQQQKIASITGFELITGTTISTDGLNKGLTQNSMLQNEISKGIKTDTVSPEPLAFIILLLVIAGLIISFFDKISDIGSVVASLLGGVLLVILSSVIPDNILGKVHYPPLSVECGTGFYITLILFIILLLYNSYLYSQRIIYQPSSMHSFDARMRVCPKCGSMNDVVSMYCNNCGSTMEDYRV
jgi:hypothetical protein